MKVKNLKVLRSIKGLSQQDAANHLGITIQSYCNKENGRAAFTLVEAQKVAELYELAVEDIFFKPLDLKVNTK